MYAGTPSRHYVRSKGDDLTATNRIHVKHDFHLETEPRIGKEVGHNTFELHSDESQLVVNAQNDQKDTWSNRSA